ncbi:MAG: DNRLRE domain-containing protein [Steroidobacteraceae bacterium]
MKLIRHVRKPFAATPHGLVFGMACTFATLSPHAQLAHAREAPVDIPTVQVPHEVSLVAAGDADVQGGAPDQNYGDDTVIHIGNPDKSVFVYFDLAAIPAGATITDARLVMNVVGSGNGPNVVKLGAVRGVWRESEVTYANQPEVAWSNKTRTISAAGPVHWNVKGPVEKWVSGQHRNRGFAIRAVENAPIWAFRSREGAPAEQRPTLLVAYTTSGAEYEPPPAATKRGANKKATLDND